MATRGSISLIREGKCYTTYTHWDSYLSHKGQMLLSHFNSEELAQAIIDLGDSSAINESIDSSVFYMRDHGEIDCEAEEFNSFEHAMENYSQEYDYVWMNGKWMVSIYNKPLVELTQELINKEEE